jgi:hypothetical protein
MEFKVTEDEKEIVAILVDLHSIIGKLPGQAGYDNRSEATKCLVRAQNFVASRQVFRELTKLPCAIIDLKMWSGE